MKLALLGVAAMAVAIAVGGTASVAGASGAYSCKDKKFKVAGFPAVTACGPATVELKEFGASYSFKNGLCRMAGTGKNRSLILYLGTSVNDPAENPALNPKTINHGYPYFSLQIGGLPGNAFITGVAHGQIVTGKPGPVDEKFTGKYTGTFVSHVELHFSGSWNCHGVSAPI
jgi:hypothetical protein